MIAADALLDWYAGNARDLPWRRPQAGPWGVLVSEIMLQQTPVARVLPAYAAWLARWPTPASRCGACPVAPGCAWRCSGSPPYDGPAKPVQRFAGTDRQVRGLLLDVLRSHAGPVRIDALDAVWHDGTQRARALDGLVADGLVDPLPDGRFALPG